MEKTINLPEVVKVKRNGAVIEIDPAKLPDAILADLIEFALGNKVGDTVASVPAQKAAEHAKAAGKDFAAMSRDAKRDYVKTYSGNPENLGGIRDASLPIMQKALDALYAGDWGVKRASSVDGLTESELEIATFIRNNKIVVDIEKTEGWKDANTAQRLVMYHARFLAAPEDVQKEIRRQIADNKKLAALKF